jgi:hypothetical protein
MTKLLLVAIDMLLSTCAANEPSFAMLVWP